LLLGRGTALRVLRRYVEPNRTTTIELRHGLPLVVWAALAVWHVAAPTEASAVALGALTGLLLAAALWARALARRVSASRRLYYAAVQVGDELEEHLALTNASALPLLWAEFVDRSDLPGYTVGSVRAADPASEVRWRARAVCTRRGLFRLGPWELRLGDPLGVFLVRQVYTDRQELLVYPPLAALPADLLPHRGQVGDRQRLRQAVRADTHNAATTRPFAPGDPLRHVHWPTSARQGALFTKVFEPESTSTVWLVPDFDAAVHVGEGPDATEETLVLLAASLAQHLLRRRLAVGLAAPLGGARPGAGLEVVVVAPRPGLPHLWAVLRALAPLHAARPLPLAEALAVVGAGQGRRALLRARDRVVVMTPTLDVTWPAALRTGARQGGVEALLLDPASFGAAGDRPGAAQAAVTALAEQGVAARVVRQGEVRPAAGAYGSLRRWEFVTLGTGRAVARQTPRSWQPPSRPGEHSNADGVSPLAA
jgi:uncharacterized protein (DUF58 family)